MESMKREDINKPLSLNDIETSTKAKLRESFELVFNVPLQQNVSLDFMKGNLAWILQAKQQKLNPIHLRKKLIKKTNGVMPKHKTLYQTGTRLSVNGKDKTMKSLSWIRTITGKASNIKV